MLKNMALISLLTAFSSCALFSAVAVAQQKETKNPVVVIETSMGDIEILLEPDKAPITVANFLAYAKEGFYDSTIFHRVIPKFMIQGGGLTIDLTQKATKAPIKNEAANGLKNYRGTIAMARTNVINSATSQFFINVVDNDFLDHKDNSAEGFGYAVFGKVIKGMDVADQIAAVKRAAMDVPVTPILINKVTVKE